MATAVGAAALGSAFAVIPSALRIGSIDVACPGTSTWAALARAAIGPMFAAILLFRGARQGIKAFGGPGKGSRAAGLVLWASLVVFVLVGFGALLRATTHHHALAGATFALGAVASGAALALVAARITQIVSQLPTSTRRATVAIGGGVLFAVSVALIRSSGRDPVSGIGAAGATIVDLLAFFIVATFASRPEFAERRSLAIGGPVAAGIVLILGWSATRGCPRLLEDAAAHAPLYGRALAAWAPH